MRQETDGKNRRKNYPLLTHFLAWIQEVPVASCMLANKTPSNIWSGGTDNPAQIVYSMLPYLFTRQSPQVRTLMHENPPIAKRSTITTTWVARETSDTPPSFLCTPIPKTK
ncbi:MAG TPA: hypothetical protein VNS32_24125 [Flavisolibacter sp.]|nr:hypothetical protein [Flavisolibacter sp.]